MAAAFRFRYGKLEAGNPKSQFWHVWALQNGEMGQLEAAAIQGSLIW